METFKKIIIKFSIVIFLIGIILVFVFFQSIAEFLFNSGDPNGEFVKVILSVFGGLGLFYGLWINSQRIKAQNKQNKLVEDRNQDQKSYDADKRFGEAIGYLGDSNTSIVLGGIYSLYQLAKEDDRYKPIVAGLFTSYIRENSGILYHKLDKERLINRSFVKAKPPIQIETIISLLFSNNNCFNGEFLDLSNSTIKNAKFYGEVRNCSFDSSLLTDCIFYENIVNCSFQFASIANSTLGSSISTIDNCQFRMATCSALVFNGILNRALEFDLTLLNDCKFSPNNMHSCSFIGSNIRGKTDFVNINSFTGTIISRKDNVKINFEHCIEDDINYV